MSSQTTTTRKRAAKKQPEPERGFFGWLHSRSTGDLLVMLIAATVCFCVLAAGGAVTVLAFVHPEVNTTAVVGTISDVINTLIGLLAGFLAGRTDAHMTIERGRIEVEKQRLEGQRATATDV